MVDPRDFARAVRAQRCRANTRRGDDAQDVIGMRLRQLGLELVQRIETGWKVERRFNPAAGRSVIAGAYPIQRVHADFTAVVPGSGRSVRCEAKVRLDDTLALHDVDPHQRDALPLHAALGGISLIGWATTLGVYVLVWPIAGFEKGSPLHADDQARIAPLLWRGVA